MDIASLSEIFDDPLLNEFTDDLLKDFDVSDLRFIHSNLENNSLVEEDRWPASNHCTLEALLKSQKPLSCVPPAPELRSELNVGNLKCTVTRGPPLQDSNAQFRRNSLPLLKHDYEPTRVAEKGTYQRSKSNLISDYLGKCDDNVDSNSPSHFRWRDQNISTAERSITKKELYSESFSGDSATDSPDQPIDISNGFRCSEISPAYEKNTYGCQTPYDEKNVKRAPHNAIEKRYRASINGRIDELRNLLIPHPTSETKLNKSAVLRQAIDRIKELEETTSRLQAELMTLRSLHASDHMKPCHSSPDSGISSSSGSSYSGLDGAGLTPPSSGVLNGTAYRLPMESPPAMYPPKDMVNSATEATDIFNWAPEVPPAANFVDFPEPGIPPYPQQVSHAYEVNTIELPHCHITEPSTANLHVVHSENGPLWRSHSGNTLTTLNTPGGRFKRRAVSIHPGPTKLRRPTVASTEYSTPHPESSAPTNMIRSASLLVKACPTSGLVVPSPATTAFSTVQRLSQSSRPSLELVANPASDMQHGQVAGSGLNGWAARTTLCMTALSLIALDPVVLSGTASDPVHSSSVPDPSSRRLLSALNSSGQTSSPWIVWLVYAVQWVVALCLCLWACRLRSQRVTRTSTQSAHALVQEEWDAGRKAMSQASWSLAEQKLSNCLAELEPGPRVASRTAPSTFAQKLISPFHGLADWLTLGLQIPSGMLVRVLPLFLTRSSHAPPTSQAKELPQRCADDEPLHQLTLANVRWSLLELYLLVPPGSQGKCLPFDDSFTSLGFLWRCIKLFLDDCLAVFVEGRTRSSLQVEQPYSVDLLLRRGITLIFVLRRFGSTRFNKLSSAFQFIVQRCIRQLACLSHPHTLWSRIASDPVLWKLVVGPGRLVITTNRTSDPSKDLFAEAVQRALEQKLMDRCSRAMVAADQATGLGSELDRSLTALLTLCSDADAHSETDGSEILSARVSHHDIQAHWWAQVIRALRTTRQQSVSDWSTTLPTTDSVVFPALPVPPPVVLQCAQTGLLAESVWLVYCPSSALDTVEAAQRCGLGLYRYVKQISQQCSAEYVGHAGVPNTALFDGDTIPYWILVCAQTIADRALHILARALLMSKTSQTQDLGVSEPGRLIESFNTAFWVLRQSSVLLRLDQTDWAVKKISYYETVRRLMAGANPVHSRFSLMHAYRDASNHTVTDPDLVSKRSHTYSHGRSAQQG